MNFNISFGCFPHYEQRNERKDKKTEIELPYLSEILFGVDG